MFSILNNIPQVTKNLLIINVLMFLVKLVAESQFHYDLDFLLGAHYFNSPLFRPFQVVTHMFMHGDFFHLLFNMFALVVFGSALEKVWGAKRFFYFYVICGIGAIILYNAIGFYEVYQLKKQLTAAGVDLYELHERFNSYNWQFNDFSIYGLTDPSLSDAYVSYQFKCLTPLIGASGAVFGVLAGFGLLFPNTNLYLMFAPFPIKAKYLIGLYIIVEIYSSISNSPGDNIAHLAHVTGAAVGALMILIYRKKRTQEFW